MCLDIAKSSQASLCLGISTLKSNSAVLSQALNTWVKLTLTVTTDVSRMGDQKRKTKQSSSKVTELDSPYHEENYLIPGFPPNPSAEQYFI